MSTLDIAMLTLLTAWAWGYRWYQRQISPDLSARNWWVRREWPGGRT